MRTQLRLPSRKRTWQYFQRLGLSALVLVLMGAAVGCRSARRGEPIVGPLPLERPEVQRGRIVFMQKCNTCHPGGEGGLGPALNDKLAPGFLIKTQVRLGLGAMPSFNSHTLPPDQLDDLVQYMIALRKHHHALASK